MFPYWIHSLNRYTIRPSMILYDIFVVHDHGSKCYENNIRQREISETQPASLSSWYHTNTTINHKHKPIN